MSEIPIYQGFIGFDSLISELRSFLGL